MNTHYMMPVYQYLTQTLLRLTGLKPELTNVIDLGGGHGLWLSYLLEHGFRSGKLVDCDPESVRIASALLAEDFASERWQAIQADVCDIPVANGEFDLVISRSSMHIWPDLPAAWHEISRITQPGAYVFVGRGFGPDLPDDVRRVVKAAKYQDLYEGEATAHCEPASLSSEELSKIAENAGFSTVAVVPDHKAYWLLAQKTN
ncbi:MAG: class I SAM-dependent methyltransferase [Candidatus Riflebacteria bacterium]|nr:class I SAM-dependent methyltransferase [Candidatus Riflebacteria bacterium]